MQILPSQAPRRRLTRPLVAAIAAVASCAAWAEDPSPYYIGVNASLTHDSNVYRTPNGIADTFVTTSLVGGFDQPIGRQRVYMAGTVGYNRYRDQTTLDHTSYGVNAGWDWATIERLSGNVSVDVNQSLSTTNGNASVPTNERNILNTEQLRTSVQWGGDAQLSVVGSYAYSRVKYSAPQSVSSNSTGNTASAGVYYSVNPDVKVGTALRFTRTDTPDYTLVSAPGDPPVYAPNSANGRNVDLSLDWRATAQTGINARVSWTNTSNSNSTAQDFSGLTWAFSGNYAPTAKLTFTAGLSRDAGTNSRYFNNPNPNPGVPVAGLSQNSQTSDSYSLGVTYAATAKISVNAGLQHRYAKTAYTTNAADSNDNLRSASLGVTWAIARAWNLGCNAYNEQRDVSGSTPYSYSANTFSCFGQFTLR